MEDRDRAGTGVAIEDDISEVLVSSTNGIGGFFRFFPFFSLTSIGKADDPAAGNSSFVDRFTVGVGLFVLGFDLCSIDALGVFLMGVSNPSGRMNPRFPFAILDPDLCNPISLHTPRLVFQIPGEIKGKTYD